MRKVIQLLSTLIICFFFLSIFNPNIRFDFSPEVIPLKVVRNRLKSLPKAEIEQMIEAGEALQFLQTFFQKTSKSVYKELIGNEKSTNWQHYPENDVIDYKNQSQYFYHSHRPEEHGHFHIFYRLNLEKKPPISFLPKVKKFPFLHLIAISLDTDGNLKELFTTNQWVTNEVWIDSMHMKEYLEKFQIEINKPSVAANQWVNIAMYFFKIPIIILLEQRDRRLNKLFTELGIQPVLKNRSIEIITQMPITIDEHLNNLKEVYTSY